jgi:hypothetical protein
MGLTPKPSKYLEIAMVRGLCHKLSHTNDAGFVRLLTTFCELSLAQTIRATSLCNADLAGQIQVFRDVGAGCCIAPTATFVSTIITDRAAIQRAD